MTAGDDNLNVFPRSHPLRMAAVLVVIVALGVTADGEAASPRPQRNAPGGTAAPAVLTVGPGRMFALPSQAAATAHDGDTIDIDSDGDYSGDTCRWSQNNLTIEGVGGGRAHIDITGGAAYESKAIWVIGGNHATISNMEFSGAHDTVDSDKNWAGIRLEGKTLTLRNDYFHDNDDGILAGATNTTPAAISNIAIFGSEFARNGGGDGMSHNMYIGHVTSFTLENSYSYDANQGHLVKSRAENNFILYNRLKEGVASAPTSGFVVDLPQGGASYLIGNLIEQGPNSANHTIIAYAEEGTLNAGKSLYMVNNTVVNDRLDGTFIWVAPSGTLALLADNIFCGPGSIATGSSSLAPTMNLVSIGSALIDRGADDCPPGPVAACRMSGAATFLPAPCAFRPGDDYSAD